MSDMSDRPAPNPSPAVASDSALNQISTRWATIGDPSQFILRYGTAIHKYLLALLKNRHEAEDVAQDFLLRFLERGGFPNARADRGRFRDYLKTAVRNAALSKLRKKTRTVSASEDMPEPADPAEPAPSEADTEWVSGWRNCLLEKCWNALERMQRSRSKEGNLFHTVLRLTADHPGEEGDQLAARATAAAGRPVKVDAFRKQVSRARRAFAGLILKEVSATLEHPDADRVEEELIDLGLMELVRDYLPGDWREALAGKAADDDGD
jgi:RNA polymerase sigma-70 factor (ECF subfamily)